MTALMTALRRSTQPPVPPAASTCPTRRARCRLCVELDVGSASVSTSTLASDVGNLCDQRFARNAAPCWLRRLAESRKGLHPSPVLRLSSSRRPIIRCRCDSAIGAVRHSVHPLCTCCCAEPPVGHGLLGHWILLGSPLGIHGTGRVAGWRTRKRRSAEGRVGSAGGLASAAAPAPVPARRASS